MKQISMIGANVNEAMAQIDALENISPKTQGCLRLLTEEMFSMIRELLETETPDFTVEYNSKQYILRILTKTRVNENAREQFLSLSSTGKNEAAKGLKGMLGNIVEFMSLEGDPYASLTSWSCGMHTPLDGYVCQWTLSHYMEQAAKEDQKIKWDGMEKSIIANFADDVSIGVRSGKLEMTVTKQL